MKKFAVLFALLSSLGLAQAEVGLFGTLDAGYNASKAPGARTISTNTESGGMTTSFWGIKGSEDLGNGSKAVVELSSFLDDSNGSTKGGTTVNTLFGSNTALYTTLTVIGRDSGARATIPVTVTKV